MSLHEEADLGQLVGTHAAAASSRRMMKPTPVTVSGVSFVSTFWLIFTTLVLCGLVVSAAFPHWIENDVGSVEKRRELDNLLRRVDIGLYYFCYEITTSLDPTSSNATFEECTPYLQYEPPATHDGSVTNLEKANLEDIAFLFSASIVYAFAFLMLVISLIVGVIAYCKPRVKNNSMFAVAFVFQVVGGEFSFVCPNYMLTCVLCMHGLELSGTKAWLRNKPQCGGIHFTTYRPMLHCIPTKLNKCT